MNYATFQAEYRRFIILKFLAEFPAYSGNSDILQMSLVDLGYVCTYEDVLSDLAFLSEKALLTLSEAGTLSVATLTRQGGDVAAGRAKMQGIRQPLAGML